MVLTARKLPSVLDLSKAFNSVLLDELKALGFRSNALDRIRSFVNNRRQCIAAHIANGIEIR